MNQGRYDRIKAMVLGALELTGSERVAYLDRECGGDGDLRREVESLLAHQNPPSILDTGGIDGKAIPEIVTATSEETAIPSNIGPYEIIGVLGWGGMGVVYHGRQTHPLEREVAIKVIRLGMDTRRVVSRFESERRALAMMDHTHISRVFDAGTDQDGRPYFVMELVRGIPITEYCAEQRLTVREKVRLLLPVCAGVQHAHQKGIIHRDLKPSNVLVNVEDGMPVPKVIDFGIAKAIEEAEGEHTFMTQDGQVLGTPQYMSPEQAGVFDAPIDTRTDVYALGVLLYELLVGDLPFEGDSGSSLATLKRMLEQEEPARPSTRAKGIPKDLDWIALKAMERDPARRYPSASELAADLDRTLNDMPVLAGPPGAGYRMGKFVRRNRIAVVGAMLVLVALVFGAVGTTWQAITATSERRRAEARLEDVQSFANSLIFGVHDQILDLPGSTEAREYIATTAVQHLDAIAADPRDARLLRRALVDAYERLGTVQEDLGYPQQSRESHEKALDQALAWVNEDPKNAGARDALANAYFKYGQVKTTLGEIGETRDLQLKAISIYEELVAAHPESISYARSLSQIRTRAAFVANRMGKPEEAVAMSRAALEFMETFAGDHPDDPGVQGELGRAHAFLGESLAEIGDDEGSLNQYRTSAGFLGKAHELDPEDSTIHRQYAVLVGAVASQELNQGLLEDAEASARRSLELRTEASLKYPANNRVLHNQARGHRTLGEVLAARGEYEDALLQFESAVAICEGIGGLDEENTYARKDIVGLLLNMGDVHLEMGAARKAEASVEQSRSLNRELLVKEPDKTYHREHAIWGAYLLGRVEALRAERSGSSAERLDRWSLARQRFAEGRGILDSMREDDVLTPLVEDQFKDCLIWLARSDSVLAD